MKILVNGEPRDVGDAKNLSELLTELNLSNRSLAIAINQEVIPRSLYEETALKADDCVELVQAVGGG